MNKKEEVVSINPSLVVNLTNKCNMKCIYCPPNGENITPSSNECNEKIIIRFINLAKKHLKMIRFTGGEPLLEPERLKLYLDAALGGFERIQINTNGLLLNNHFDWLQKYRQNIILKVSLDTIDKREFLEITRCDKLNSILYNIEEAAKLGFNVEINTVLSIQKFNNIIKLIEFAKKLKVNIKILTISSYCGLVNRKTNKEILLRLINYLEQYSNYNSFEKLLGERGISMLTFQLENCTIQIVDHSTTFSKTPNRQYFNICKTACEFFPCESGAISIILSSNGDVSLCNKRILFKKLGKKACDSDLRHILNTSLSEYSKCVNININHLNFSGEENYV